VLSIIDKKGRVLGPLSVAEHSTMLAAFACTGVSARARASSADVVRACQQRQGWFRCDCLGTIETAPLLIPVAETFIRRHAHGPDHADSCRFEMDPGERERNVQRLREDAPRGGFRLARAITNSDAALVLDGSDRGAEDNAATEAGAARRAGHGVVKAYERIRLSQLLCKLLSDAKLQDVGPTPRRHADQVQAIYEAAGGISLGGDLRLSGVLGIDPTSLDVVGSLMQRRGAGRQGDARTACWC